MESLLIVVMVLAVVLAVGASVFAWRVLRRDRHRSDARVARLQSLAVEPTRDWEFDEPEPADAVPYAAAEPEPVAVPPIAAPVAPRPRVAARHIPDLSGSSPDLFAAAVPATPGPRWGALAIVTVVFMSLGAGGAYALYGSNGSLNWPVLTSLGGDEPLALLSLSHRREGGEFVVTGLVENPSSGRAAASLTAVIYLFDNNGQYFASGRATLEDTTLRPGELSPFEVRIKSSARVSRYRVGFRQDDGEGVAHVDRRGDPVAGTTIATVEEGR
jgi:hypothetical protein